MTACRRIRWKLYARVDHSSGLFWKGYAGGGLLTQGNLQDEDFPPGITPYSSTNSTLQNQIDRLYQHRFRRRDLARHAFPASTASSAITISTSA